MQRNSMPAAAAGAAAADGERWDSFPIYLGGSESRPFHLVKFLSTLPLAYGTTAAPGAAGAAAPSAAAAASSAAAAAATPAMRPGELGVLPPPSASSTAAAAAAAANSAKLLFPFAKETRLVSPRHVDFRSKFIQRKKVMKQALPSNAGAGAVAAAAAKADDKAAAADGEGVNPLDRKWRLEDAHPRTQRNAPSYIGAHEPVPRKEIHQQQPNHFVLLMRHEGRFTLVPADNYAFRHVDAAATGPGAILTLEEAEQKMKTRMRRFEKRVRGMATLQAQNDEEEGGPSAGGGGGGGGGGGMALERARPTLTGKIQPAPREDKADDAFSEMGVIMGKGGAQPLGLSAGARKAVALARAAKLKREGGADYTRQFDDDDVDFGGEDRLDGQGGEADEEMRDEEEILREEQAAQEAANEALERANKLALARKPGMSMDEVEQQAMAEEEAEEGALSEGEGDDDKGPAAGGAASKSSKKDVASESSSDDESDYDDEDLSLEDDEEDEEEEEKEEQKQRDVKVKYEQPAAPAAAAATPAPTRKRPISPAVGTGSAAPSATKKAKVEGGTGGAGAGAAGASAGAPAGAAAAPSAGLTPAEVAELQRLVIIEMQSAPASSPFTAKSIALHMREKYPAKVSKNTIGALREVIKKVVSIQPDKTHIILKKEFQKTA